MVKNFLGWFYFFIPMVFWAYQACGFVMQTFLKISIFSLLHSRLSYEYFNFRFFINSSATLKVGNDIGAVLGVSDSCEGHGVAWGESRWLFQPLVKVTVSPFDRSF